MKILLIEDDRDDIELLQEALDDNNVSHQMDVIDDGGLVAEYVQKCTDLPDIIILDFNLPRVHGKELLKFFKANENFKNIPIIILTTSSARADMEYSLREGAHKFLIKPSTVAGINLIISAIIESV